MSEFFDTHAHLNAEQFEGILDEVVDRARKAGVCQMVVVGTELTDSQRAVEIAREFDGVYAAVGIQPNYVSEANPSDFERIEELAALPEVVAIGETGLDRYWDRAPFELQQRFFEAHMALAERLQKPFVVHMRECDLDIVNAFQAFDGERPFRGIMHSFTGSEETATQCLEFGMMVSFAGMVTYKKSDELRKVAELIPMDKLLIETDCPYLSPHPKRGQRPNEPALVVHTAEVLANVKNVSLEELARYTTRNARQLFGLE